MEEATAAVMGLANIVDTLFVRYTGRTVADLLKESAQRPRELPAGEKTSPIEVEPSMPLDWAYSVLGLKPDASLDDVKRNYRNLAAIMHPDKGGYTEAMRLINQAYERITKKV